MKTKSLIKNTAAVLLLLVGAQCTSDLKQLNVDPTSATLNTIDPNYLLTNCQVTYTGSADFSYETWRTQLIHFSTMMQHFSHVAGYWVGDKYTLNLAYQASYFQCGYGGDGGDLGQIKNIVPLVDVTKGDAAHSNLYQIARIWKVVEFHRLTDIYGDVPYFQAGHGYDLGILTPVYDKQQDIYMDMLNELDEAATALDPTKDTPTGDIIYGGNITKWKKFAYSMMLRLGTRLSKVDQVNSQKYIEKAAAGGTFSSISDNALVFGDPSNGRPTVNRISQILQLSYEMPSIRWSKTYIDFLKNNNDPRLSVVAELPPPPPNGAVIGAAGDNTAANQQGMPNGHDESGIHSATDVRNEPNYPDSVVNGAGVDILGNYSRPRAKLLANLSSPTFIITYAETELMLAEAAELGYSVTGSAASHYNNGVTAAMAQLSQFDATLGAIDPAAIAAYLTANPYASATGIQMINTQYWAATIFNDYETFANWRRSGWPALVPVNYPGNATAGTIPRRLIYPQTEAAVNGTNYNAAVGRISGGDKMTSRVWWDQ